MLNPHQRLGQLVTTYPLPSSFTLQEPLFEHLELGALELSMVGLIATAADGQSEAIGAAAEPGTAPVDRAYFELLERVCTLLAMSAKTDSYPEVDITGTQVGHIDRDPVFPTCVQYPPVKPSFTNGVALHRTYARACRAALHELVERDALLRAWYGWYPSTPIALPDTPFYRWAATHYDVSACEFGPPQQREVHSVGLLARPRNPQETPLVFSSGGGASTEEALNGAEREAVQRLSFLWGEDIPEAAPQFSASVDYHQAYYLVPAHHALLERFCRWGHTDLTPRGNAPLPLNSSQVRFADLTPQGGLAGGLKVVRAVCPNALPVLFGHCDFAEHLPTRLQVHPIS